MTNPNADWFRTLLASRDRETANESRRVGEGADGRQFIESAATRAAHSIDRFGKDGAGFLAMLADPPADFDFWEDLRALLAWRRPVLHHHAPEVQSAVATLLSSLPPSRRIPILAAGPPADLTPRKNDPVAMIFADYLKSETADLRHIEPGIALPDRSAALSRPDREFLAAQVSGKVGAFRAFTAAAEANAEALESGNDSGFTTFEHALAHLKSGDIRALPDSYLDTLIEGPAPARRYGEGGTEAELNMAKLNALLLLSRRQGSRHYKGFYLNSALAKLPPGGFYRFRIDLFPRDKVWPYLASRFPLLDRAIGRKPALPFDPYIDRLRALRLLQTFPKLPARYMATLQDLQRGRKGALQKEAADLLSAAARPTP